MSNLLTLTDNYGKPIHLVTEKITSIEIDTDKDRNTCSGVMMDNKYVHWVQEPTARVYVLLDDALKRLKGEQP